MPENVQSPNDRLAEAVVESLVDSGLLKTARQVDAMRLLTTSRVAASQWRIWAEDFAKEEAKNETETTSP